MVRLLLIYMLRTVAFDRFTRINLVIRQIQGWPAVSNSHSLLHHTLVRGAATTYTIYQFFHVTKLKMAARIPMARLLHPAVCVDTAIYLSMKVLDKIQPSALQFWQFHPSSYAIWETSKIRVS